jgi:hypothetical protein
MTRVIHLAQAALSAHYAHSDWTIANAQSLNSAFEPDRGLFFLVARIAVSATDRADIGDKTASIVDALAPFVAVAALFALILLCLLIVRPAPRGRR